jgi:hypothetical protein
MKKFILAIILITISSTSYSKTFAEMFAFGKEKTGDIVGNVTKRCKITENTPLKDIIRPPFELGASWGIIDSPAGGQTQVRVENVNITAVGNLSSTFHWYAWVGTRTTEKDEYEYPDSEKPYDQKWQSTMGFAGFGLYILPTIRLFGGAGQIQLDNADGDPPQLGTAQEYGIAWSQTWYNNRIEIMYRVVNAPLSDDMPSVYDAVASGSFNAISIGLFFPLGDQ